MGISPFEVLISDAKRAERLTASRDFLSKRAITGDWPKWANPQLVNAYQTIGVSQPWLHQIAAADAIYAGQTVALATATGTGKSLSFWLSALSSVMDDDSGSTVLYLAPTKALAADQLVSLNKLLSALPVEVRRPQVATCDGDTPAEERRYILDYANIVLTNPDFVHYSMLPGHRRWTRFLKNLKLVVVDEGHHYRGVFGSHVAQILRRVTRLATFYGQATPEFVVASATSADPVAATSRLVGVPMDDVMAFTSDTAPQGTRTFALWQPPEIPAPTRLSSALDSATNAQNDGVTNAHSDNNLFGLPDPMADPVEADQVPIFVEPPLPAFDPFGNPLSEPIADLELPLVTSPPTRRSAGSETSELLSLMASCGVRTLAFTRSRRGAETIASSAKTQLQKSEPLIADRISAYRGGYLPEERRQLEHDVRVGEILGLATTNALELGVDISGLDAVLVSGWPGTMMSLWQQAGRAGRAGADGLVVFIARDDPLDQYLVTHPDAVFDRPLEQVVFDPENRFVLAGHLCAAAAERPVQVGELAKFGNPDRVAGVLAELTEAGILRRRDSGWYWTHHESAAALVDIRGAGGSPIRVVERRTGLMLGTVDSGSADYQVHTGAVYVHQNAMFVVDELDLKDRVALVTRRKVDYGTWARQIMSLEIEAQPTAIGAEVAEKQWGPVHWGLGPIEVTTQVISFERRRIPDLSVLGTEELDLPERKLNTTGVWFTIPDDDIEQAGITRDQVPGALHAAEHAAIALLPLFATCDRWDLGGLSTDHHQDAGAATVFVYDALPGGAGFAARGYEIAEQWLTATRDLIVNCSCEYGCPACIQSPKCGNYNSPLEKQAAIELLNLILSYAPSEQSA